MLVNPLIYISEGMRAALTNGVPHMALWAIYLALIGFTVRLPEARHRRLQEARPELTWTLTAMSYDAFELAEAWARRAGFVDGDERVAELVDPLAFVVADEAHAPRERVGAAAGDARADERVEHLALRHAQPRHHRHRERREHPPLVAADRAPRDLAAGALLGLVGDPHALLAGVLTEPLDARLAGGGAGRVVGVLRVLGLGERADDEDLLAVGRSPSAGPVNQSSGSRPANQPVRSLRSCVRVSGHA